MSRPAVLTGPFWSDALERVGSTLTQGLVAAMIVAGGFGKLDEWAFWEPVLWITVLALAKSLAAGFISPNTGASLGTTVPGGLVSAYTTQTEQGSYGGKSVAHPGDTVAGPAAPVPDGLPVDVTKAGPSPYTAQKDLP